MATAFESVSDKASAEKARTDYKGIMDKIAEVDTKFNALPSEAKNGAMGANSVQFQQVSERLTKAKEKSSKF